MQSGSKASLHLKLPTSLRGALLETTRWAKLMLSSRLSLQFSSSLQNRHPLELQLHLRRSKSLHIRYRACSLLWTDVAFFSIKPRQCQSDCLEAHYSCKEVQQIKCFDWHIGSGLHA